MCPTHWDAEMTFYRTFSFNWQFGKLVEYFQTASDISHAIIWECQSYSRHKLSKVSIFCRKNHQKYEYTPYVVWFGHIAKHCSAGVNLTLLPANRRHRSLHMLQFSICVWYYEIFLWHNAHKTSYHYIYTAMTHDYFDLFALFALFAISNMSFRLNFQRLCSTVSVCCLIQRNTTLRKQLWIICCINSYSKFNCMGGCVPV